MKRKCHIFSLVERVELYRLVYSSIFSLNDFRGKTRQKLKVNFLPFFKGFLRVTKVNPLYPSKGKSSDRQTLDSSMVD